MRGKERIRTKKDFRKLRRNRKARLRKKGPGYTYMSIVVKMNQVMRYNPSAFANSCVSVPYAATTPLPGMRMVA